MPTITGYMDVDMDVGTTAGQAGGVSLSTTSADSRRLPQASEEESVFSASHESINCVHEPYPASR